MLMGWLLCWQMAFAQQPPVSNLRSKKIAVAPTIQQIDSVSIIPNTFRIPGVPTTDYLINEVTATLTWLQKQRTDSVRISSLSFGMKLEAAIRQFSYDSSRDNLMGKPFVFNSSSLFQQENNLFNFG